MVRENSFSDSDGRSLTPDLDEEIEQDFIGTSIPVAASPVPDSSSPRQAEPDQLTDTQPDNPSSNTRSTSSSVLFQDPPGKVMQSKSAPSSVPIRTAMADVDVVRSASTEGKPARPGLASERFRSSVRKIIHLNRGSSALSLGGVGAEPGVDPRRSSAFLNYSHIYQRCNIELVDYSSLRTSFGRMENKGFVELMNDTKASKREPWVRVRWINIGGVSWDVISSLALRYDIHPLALEDVLHQRASQSRSKADYYVQHLFLRVLRHTLAASNNDDPSSDTLSGMMAPTITRLPRSSSPDPMQDEEHMDGSGGWGDDEPDDERTLAGSKFSTKRRVGSMRKAMSYGMSDIEMGEQRSQRGRVTTTNTLRMRRKHAAESKAIEELKRGERVNVATLPFFIFLFRDGTVISINQSPDINFTAPITARLRQRDTGLRATADPSLLVQSLLDLIVDQALEVVDEYQTKIFKLEREVLIKPKMKTVRYRDLTLHKRTLEPIRTLVYGLRRYDIDRCAALVNSLGGNASTVKVEGFMSHKSKIYLADVHDHIDYIISSLDMFSSISENLINFTFNMASYQMNEVMRRLTMATIIFLPLTLLTGYFGMNFTPFSAVDNHSDALFWEIAIPVMVAIVPMFLWPDFERMYHYMKKRWTTPKAVKLSTKRKMQ